MKIGFTLDERVFWVKMFLDYLDGNGFFGA
jgi:hypothetical protein